MTHECDYPADVLNLPKVTRDVIGPGLPPDEIDRAVRALTEQGRSIYELDEEGLRRLAPDLIVTQALCTVCAVSVDDVRAIAERMDPVPKIVSLDPHTIGEVLGDVRSLAQATDRKDAGVELVQDAAARIDRVRVATRGVRAAYRVAMLEWLDPIFVGGHWVPQLIEYAGGVDLLGLAGRAVRAALVGGGRRRQAAGRDRRAVRLRRRARLRGSAHVRRRTGRTRRREDRRGRRRRVVLAPGPAPGRGPGVARPRAPPRPRAGAARRRPPRRAQADRDDRARHHGGAHDHAGDDRRHGRARGAWRSPRPPRWRRSRRSARRRGRRARSRGSRTGP